MKYNDDHRQFDMHFYKCTSSAPYGFSMECPSKIIIEYTSALGMNAQRVCEMYLLRIVLQVVVGRPG